MAKEMEKLAVKGHHHLTFIIGGSNGLSPEVLDEQISRFRFQSSRSRIN